MYDWVVGIRKTVLSKVRITTITVGSEAVAEQLVGYGWSDETCTNRLAQIRRWIMFCDDDNRSARPTEEGDAVAFIRYL